VKPSLAINQNHQECGLHFWIARASLSIARASLLESEGFTI